MIVVLWGAVIRHNGIDTPAGGSVAAGGIVLLLVVGTWLRGMAKFDRALGTPRLWLPPRGGDGPPRWGIRYDGRVELTPRNLPDPAVVRARLWLARPTGEGTATTLWESTREVARLAAGLTVDPDAPGDGSAPGYPVTWTLPHQAPAMNASFSAVAPEWWVTLEAFSEGASSAMGARWVVHFRLGPTLP